MENDLISRKALLESIWDEKAYADSFAYRIVACKVASAPSIEAEPVRHGRWVMMEGFLACNECGCSPADWEQKPYNPQGLPPYCHSCGAKMDAKEDA